MDFKNTHLSHPGQGWKPAKPVIATVTAFRKRVKKVTQLSPRQSGECSGVNNDI